MLGVRASAQERQALVGRTFLSQRGQSRSWRVRPICDRALSGVIEQKKEPEVNATVLWVIAAILVIVGIVQLIQGQILFGVALIVVGCLVGPGGYSIFRNRQVGS